MCGSPNLTAVLPFSGIKFEIFDIKVEPFIYDIYQGFAEVLKTANDNFLSHKLKKEEFELQ